MKDLVFPIIEAIQSGLPVVAATGSCLEKRVVLIAFMWRSDDVDGNAAAILSAIENRKEIVSRANAT